jgi:hypothetical protein
MSGCTGKSLQVSIDYVNSYLTMNTLVQITNTTVYEENNSWNYITESYYKMPDKTINVIYTNASNKINSSYLLNNNEWNYYSKSYLNGFSEYYGYSGSSNNDYYLKVNTNYQKDVFGQVFSYGELMRAFSLFNSNEVFEDENIIILQVFTDSSNSSMKFFINKSNNKIIKQEDYNENGNIERSVEFLELTFNEEINDSFFLPPENSITFEKETDYSYYVNNEDLIKNENFILPSYLPEGFFMFNKSFYSGNYSFELINSQNVMTSNCPLSSTSFIFYKSVYNNCLYYEIKTCYIDFLKDLEEFPELIENPMYKNLETIEYNDYKIVYSNSSLYFIKDNYQYYLHGYSIFEDLSKEEVLSIIKSVIDQI